jgi:GNAT superfamily N-acetyltransferase
MLLARTMVRHGEHGMPSGTTRCPRIATRGASDMLAIDLLRNLDPERLILYGERRPNRDEWERHCCQRSDCVLVATISTGADRRVAGSLEFRIVASAQGDRGMIDRLYVDPRHRRRGIASCLLRAIIAFARERGLASLRGNIPNVLVRDPVGGSWRPHIPAGDGWGGLRSLGATINACVREHQPCAISGAHRGHNALREPGGRRCERIDATLTLPIARVALAETPRARVAGSGAELRDRLLRDLAAFAGVPLTPPNQVVNQTTAARERA